MVRQASLFDQDVADASLASIRFAPSFEGWQLKARALVASGVAPESVWWCEDPTIAEPAAAAAPGPALRVPRRFVDLARPASHHASVDRWALLYRMLWRITHGEHHLMQLASDPDVVRLENWSKAVRRDAHKMKAFVRFREVRAPDGELRYVAWFEPSHHSLTYTADFFRRRFSNMAWSILTPDCCAHYEGAGSVWFTDGVTREKAASHDAFEDAWRLYYRSIFNPARLKLAAMRAEMPVKYWKNLPEAQDIALLVRQAQPRVAAMQARQAHDEVLRCGPLPLAPSALFDQARQRVPAGTLDQLALELVTCRRCPLWEPATQAVPGRGARDARLMLVGEQPGDQEDLAGRPFAGPAGQLLRNALREAGIDAESVWMTNTVKHFGFRVRGRRRLHQRPTEAAVKACVPFVRAEMALIDPALVVCLGYTAAQALIGPQVRVLRDRGQVIEHEGRRYLLTVHPAWLLRHTDREAARGEYERFVADLANAASLAKAY